MFMEGFELRKNGSAADRNELGESYCCLLVVYIPKVEFFILEFHLCPRISCLVMMIMIGRLDSFKFLAVIGPQWKDESVSPIDGVYFRSGYAVLKKYFSWFCRKIITFVLI